MIEYNYIEICPICNSEQLKVYGDKITASGECLVCGYMFYPDLELIEIRGVKKW